MLGYFISPQAGLVHFRVDAGHGFVNWLTLFDGKRCYCRKTIQAHSSASRIYFRSLDVHVGSCFGVHLLGSWAQQKLHRTIITDTMTVLGFPSFNFALSSASEAAAGKTTTQILNVRCSASDFELGRRIHTVGAGSWLLMVPKYSDLQSH